MKKIFLLSAIVISGFTFANDSDNPFVYDEAPLLEEEEYPAAPYDPAPIDQYIPVLVLSAVAIAFAYAKKRKAV